MSSRTWQYTVIYIDFRLILGPWTRSKASQISLKSPKTDKPRANFPTLDPQIPKIRTDALKSPKSRIAIYRSFPGPLSAVQPWRPGLPAAVSSFCIRTLFSPLSIPTVPHLRQCIAHFSASLYPASRRAYSRGIITRTAAIDSLMLNHTPSLASPIFLPSQPTHCRSPGLDRSQAPRFGHPRLVQSMCARSN